MAEENVALAVYACTPVPDVVASEVCITTAHHIPAPVHLHHPIVAGNPVQSTSNPAIFDTQKIADDASYVRASTQKTANVELVCDQLLHVLATLHNVGITICIVTSTTWSESVVLVKI